ncbi:retrovirus-related pol polyprotein from transposon TNT 1-94 [Tanacetum coccineum]
MLNRFPNRNNREVHLDYLRHLKESVETLREIVEEAKVKRPLDRSIVFAFRYTKHSQGLLEYAIDTCPKDFNQRDKKHAPTPLIRKKQVTFKEQCDTVNCYTNASGSHSRSNTKKNRISPAKGINKKKVKEHPRTNKSNLRTTNRVDSSSSSMRTVINSNSNSVCQTCNKCLISANHNVCVVDYLQSVKASPSIHNIHNVVRKVKQVWKPKQVRQVWKPTGKVLTSVGHQWRPVGRIFTLGEQCPLTRLTKPKVAPANQNENQAITCANQQEPNQNWGSNFPNSPSSSVFKCKSYRSSFVRFGNDHFGAIIGYGDYVIGDSVISRVYYVEGLGHNLFSVGQFCDSDLEVAFRNHSCYNGVVERRNRTLVEAARTMLIFSKALMFLWAEAVATTCYTQNRSLIHTRHCKTPYELVHNKKPDLTFFRVFGALCYPTNDSEDLGKLQPTADIRIFVGYAPSRKGYRIYNKRTRRIMETIHVQFDELTEQMAPVQLSTGPAPTFLTPGQISLGLVPNSVPAAPYVPPTNKELEILFQPMFDEYMEPPRVERLVSPAPAVSVPVNSAGTPSSTTIDQDAPSPSHSPSYSALQSPSLHKGVAADSTLMEDNPFAPVDNHPFINVFAPEPSSEASSSGDLSSAESPYVSQTLHHLGKWSKDHPLDNIIGNPSRPVSTRKQLATDALWCLYNSVLSKVKPKNFKSAIIEDCWFQAMQDEIHEFDRLQV